MRSWSAPARAIRPRCLPQWGSRSSRSKALPSWRRRHASFASTSWRARSRPAIRKGAHYHQILIDGAVEVIPDAIDPSSPMAAGSARRSSTAASRVEQLAVRRASRSAISPSAMRGLRRCPASHARKNSPFKGQRVFRRLISASLVAALMAGTASADKLREALVSAYQTNPTLTAQRETLRGTDATVAIAERPGRPRLAASRSQPRSRPKRDSPPAGKGTKPVRRSGSQRAFVQWRRC